MAVRSRPATNKYRMQKQEHVPRVPNKQRSALWLAFLQGPSATGWCAWVFFFGGGHCCYYILARVLRTRPRISSEGRSKRLHPARQQDNVLLWSRVEGRRSESRDFRQPRLLHADKNPLSLLEMPWHRGDWQGTLLQAITAPGNSGCQVASHNWRFRYLLCIHLTRGFFNYLLYIYSLYRNEPRSATYKSLCFKLRARAIGHEVTAWYEGRCGAKPAPDETFRST